MPDPIELRVIQSLQTALRSISVAGGYFHDVTSLAVKLDIDAAVEDIIGGSGARPFIVLEVTPEAFTYFPAEQVRVNAPFIVHFVDDTDPLDDDAMLEKYYRLCADVEQAIAVDGTRGALATDTVITNREKRKTAEGQLVWAQVTAEVKLNRTYGAPNG